MTSTVKRTGWMQMGLVALFLVAALGVAKERRFAASLQRQLDSAKIQSASIRTVLRLKLRGYQRLAGHVQLADGMQLRGIDGSGQEILFHPARERGRTLPYSIVPDCPSCWAPLPYLNAVAADSDCTVRIVAIIAGDTASFRRADHGQSHISLVFTATGRMWDALPLSPPGSAVLLGDSGRIDHLWPGTPEGLPVSEVAAELGRDCEVQESARAEPK